MGRTGKWFAYQQHGVAPDMLITAKALGAGFPVSLVAFKKTLLARSKISISHFSSHQNDPLAGAIVVGVIAEIQEKKLLHRVERIGDFFLQQLRSLSTRTTLLSAPRGMGLMIGFDLSVVGLESYLELGNEFTSRLREEGVLIQSTSHGKTYRILPSYYLTKREVLFCIASIEKVLHQLLK